MTRIPTPLRATITVGLAWAILIGAITLGLMVPSLELLRGFGGEGHLDYSHHSGFFTTLTRGFVSRILGLGSEDLRASGSGTSRIGRGSGTGNGRIDVDHAFTNDDFERAYDIPGLPFRARTDTTGAKRQSGEPSDCLATGGTAWYRYKAPSEATLFSDTFGTNGTTALGVYSGNSRGALKLIGCDTNVLGNAQVGFRATAGATYYFQVTGLKGGPTVFGLAAVGPTTIESLSPSGGEADSYPIYHPEISGDGRYVAFASFAHNLAPTPPDCGPKGPDRAIEGYCVSLYMRDRVTGVTSRIAEQGQPYRPCPTVAGPCIPLQEGSLLSAASVSDDGRYLAFSAYYFTPPKEYDGYHGTPDDPEKSFNVYVYDRVTRSIELASRNSAGEPARNVPTAENGAIGGGSYSPSISAGGRYVIFDSDAYNLGGPGAPGEYQSAYLRDRMTGVTKLVSTDSFGQPIQGNSCAASGRNVSADGRFVTFMSSTGSGNRSNFLKQVYLWDAHTGRSRLVSKLPPGTSAQGTYCPTISREGSHVAMVSRDPLVPEDTNGTPDVYVYEVSTDRIKRVSVTTSGEQATDPAPDFAPSCGCETRAVSLSADGRYVAFDFAAPGLAPGTMGSTHPGPGVRHVYVHDLLTSSTILASVSSTGEPLAGVNIVPHISHDGRAVAFVNLGPTGMPNIMVHELR